MTHIHKKILYSDVTNHKVMNLQLPMQSVPITTKVGSLNTTEVGVLDTTLCDKVYQ